MRLVSIDPGLGGTGVASWHDGKLVDVAVFITDPAWPLVERVKQVYDSVEPMIRTGTVARAQLVIEYQQTYGGRAAKGDANDLLKATLLSGALVQLGEHVQLVTPHEWKGNAKKEITAARCEADLSAAEFLMVVGKLGKNKKLRGDVWDAVGIGLWWLRRAELR